MTRAMIMAVALLTLLAMPMANAAPFLQYMGDAGRTGDLLGPGPANDDVALVVPIEGNSAFQETPLIIDGLIYLATSSSLEDSTNLKSAIWRVDPASAEVKLFIDFPDAYRIGGLASDGERLFAHVDGEVHAWYMDGQSAWAQPYTFPFVVDDASAVLCRPAAVDDDQLFMFCYQSVWSEAINPVVAGDNEQLRTTSGKNRVVVAAIDTQTGAEIWTYVPDPTPQPDPNVFFAVFEGPQSPTVAMGGGGVSGDAVWFSTFSVGTDARADREMLTLLERQTGTPRWTWTMAGRMVANVFPETVDGRLPDFGELSRYTVASSIAATPTESQLVLHLDGLWGVNWESGNEDWTERLPVTAGSDQSSAIGQAAGRVFVSSSDMIHAFDSETWAPIWSTPLRGETGSWGDGLHIADGVVYVRLNGGGIRGLDWNTGDVVFDRATTGGSANAIAIGDGMLVRMGLGQLVVYGELEGGIKLDIAGFDEYPKLDQELTIDLLGSASGIQGDDLEFTVAWGDGSRDGPTSEPVFTHRYQKTGPWEMVVTASNEAGQESRSRHIIHAGEARPTSNFVSEAFSPERQESTFFTLGLIATLLFAGFGAIRLRRKRGTLRKELAKADAIVGASKDDPDQLREQLRDHRSKARRLFLDGRLDEGSTGILERHIDELLRDHRLSSVEEEMSFLPHGLFRAMQEMLRDAKVTALERTQFVRSLQAEKSLTAAQKKRVQRHVENWHREDAN